MATSLSKIKTQIAKLQKQAATIESGIVARIKAEIAKHGLTAEHLFGASGGGADIGGRAAPKRKPAAKAATSSTPKFADASGNSWGGMGKRPQWIHDALAAGKSLDDFLVNGKAAGEANAKSAKAKTTEVKTAPAKTAKVARKAAPKKPAAVKKAAPEKAAKSSAAVKRPVKAAAKKSAVKKPAAKRAAAALIEPAQAPAA